MKKFDLIRIADEWKVAEAENRRPGDSTINGGKDWLVAFDTEAEAMEALKGYQNHYTLLSSAAGSFFDVEEFVVEANEYDDDGEFIGGDVVELADASDWDIALNHDWLRRNKFTLKIAEFNGSSYGEWMILEDESEDWFDDVADYLKALDRNGYFDKDAATRGTYYYKVVATYSCDDANEDDPMTWSELAELAED